MSAGPYDSAYKKITELPPLPAVAAVDIFALLKPATASENPILYQATMAQLLTFINTVAGFVIGPAASLDGEIVIYDGTTGKLIKQSGLQLSVVNAHIADPLIHFTEASVDHANILSIGVNSHAQIDSHLADVTIHFTEASIDHGNILSIGINTHVQIDTHIADGTVHFTEAAIDHANILSIGVNSHAQIDTHIADGSVHFTEGSIDHANIQNNGTNTHAQIDTHLADVSNPHAVDIDDVTPTTTKGDLIIENATNAVRIPVGADTFVLVADSSEAVGAKWQSPAVGPGSISDQQSVSSTVLTSTTSLTFVDLSLMTLTTNNTVNLDYTILFQAIVENTQNNATITLQCMVDGVVAAESIFSQFLQTKNNPYTANTIALKLNVADAKIVKIQWKTDKGTAEITTRTFIISGKV